MSKAISSQAVRAEGSETMEKSSRLQAESKRPAPTVWGDDIVQSGLKRSAAEKTINGNYVVDENGCWNWSGAKSHGYGISWIREIQKDRPIYMHRLNWVLHHGVIRDGLFVCHHCDNPLCINPDHLFLGTQKDNLVDMAKKGRSSFGTKNGQAKLNDPQVQLICLLATDGVKQCRLAETFGVSQGQVSRIVRGSRRQTARGVTRKQHGNYRHGKYAAQW